MDTRKRKIMFWLMTAPLALFMTISGATMLARLPQNIEGTRHLGYPVYFLTYIGIAKILGVIALIVRRNKTLTEWAYAGFTFLFLAASYSHFSSGDAPGMIMAPLIFLGLALGSRQFGKDF